MGLFAETQNVRYTGSPVVTFALTDPPGVSNLPTAVPTSLASPVEETMILVESTLALSFDAEVTARKPTSAEIDGLMVQIEQFYTDIIGAAYDNLLSFEAEFVSALVTPSSLFPVVIFFNADGIFSTGTFDENYIYIVRCSFVLTCAARMDHRCIYSNRRGIDCYNGC